jgi:AraC family transcriptional regulator of adaptative response / DNA-3-methyladenine glycosylase II
VARCRALLDLDADPVAVDEHLARDPRLAPLVASGPGRRVPRTVDAEELAVRIVLGQQVSTAAARTLARRLAAAHGPPLSDPSGGLTHCFPSPDAIAAIDPQGLAMPRARARSLVALAEAMASGVLRLGPGEDWAGARAVLGALPGIGPWSVEMVAMRGLGDPDAFPATDLGVRAGLTSVGIEDAAGAAAARRQWRPWASYAVQHLWATGNHAVNRPPTADLTTDASTSSSTDPRTTPSTSSNTDSTSGTAA